MTITISLKITKDERTRDATKVGAPLSGTTQTGEYTGEDGQAALALLKSFGIKPAPDYSTILNYYATPAKPLGSSFADLYGKGWRDLGYVKTDGLSSFFTAPVGTPAPVAKPEPEVVTVEDAAGLDALGVGSVVEELRQDGHHQHVKQANGRWGYAGPSGAHLKAGTTEPGAGLSSTNLVDVYGEFKVILDKPAGPQVNDELMDPADLDLLPVGSRVIDSEGDAWEKEDEGWTLYEDGEPDDYYSNRPATYLTEGYGPVTVTRVGAAK